MLTRWDKYLIIAIFVIASIGFAWVYGLSPDNVKKTAVIEINGQVKQTIALVPGQKRTLSLPPYTGVIEVDGERIRVRDDDTPRHIGVNTGWITKAPQTIVVLPYRLVIRIVQAESDVDEITR